MRLPLTKDVFNIRNYTTTNNNYYFYWSSDSRLGVCRLLDSQLSAQSALRFGYVILALEGAKLRQMHSVNGVTSLNLYTIQYIC